MSRDPVCDLCRAGSKYEERFVVFSQMLTRRQDGIRDNTGQSKFDARDVPEKQETEADADTRCQDGSFPL